MIASPVLMLLVVWNPAGFHVVDVLSNGGNLCPEYHMPHIMDILFVVLQPDEQHPFRKLFIQADNAHVHTSKLSDEYSESRCFRQPIIRCIHQTWHVQTSFCFASLKDS
jgi:hypothetical protein